jgi:uncharacterized membrane protein
MSEPVNVSSTERWLSSIGGGALMAVALRRAYHRSLLGFALLFVAGHHLYRGIQGHDRFYAALGINTADDQGDEATSVLSP